MGANSSCCFCIAKAEDSPCTDHGGVADLDPWFPGEDASTSEKPEYYSARCEAMMRSRGQFSDAVALEIEFSKSHWSEVSRLEVAPQSAEEEELNRENRELLKQFKEQYPGLFRDSLDFYVLGRMIAKGGQAEIYEVVGRLDRLMKVFDRGTSLRDLQQSWPLPILKGDVRQCILGAGMLEDGRFAFLMERCWGDLRKLIDQAMQEKNDVNSIHYSSFEYNEGSWNSPPFPYDGWKEAKGWNLHALDFIFGIAWHMQDLHEKGVSHRDLKASNILLQRNLGIQDNTFRRNVRGIIVADFECSIGVLGTEFWRAPEILAALQNQETITHEQWKKADVYSYGMTCFEILTGRIPFDGELENTRADRQLVIEGKRPQLPIYFGDRIKELIIWCWEPNPNFRPTFSKIIDMLKEISPRQFQFRLLGIGDE